MNKPLNDLERALLREDAQMATVVVSGSSVAVYDAVTGELVAEVPVADGPAIGYHAALTAALEQAGREVAAFLHGQG